MQEKREEITDEKYEEMRQIASKNICAECGAELQVHTVPEDGTLRVGCLNRNHHGWVERESFTQGMRRGAIVPQPVEDAIRRKMIPKDELGRAMNLLALRYPDAIKDPATAALFLMDCTRLDLDPLISPAEAVPIPFKSKIKDDKGKIIGEKTTITMIITSDGWLSMAARGCPQDYVGPPRTMRLEEYLTTLPENEGRPYEEIEKMAASIKESDCEDPNAWYYVAIGRRRDGDDTAIPGWFTHNDKTRASDSHLPAGTQPGNQARIRAIKKWVRNVFPECRQRMIELTSEWYHRAEGIQEAQTFIDAEYSLINVDETGKSNKKFDQNVNRGGGEKTSIRPEDGEKGVEQVTGQRKGADKEPGRGEEHTAQNTFSPSEGDSSPKKSSSVPAEEFITGEGFTISLTKLAKAQKIINWPDDTLLSYLASEPYKVTGKTVAEALKQLTREKAEKFMRAINDKTESIQPGLFD